MGYQGRSVYRGPPKLSVPHEGLGPRFKRLRRRAGLTVHDLAARAGVSTPYISLIENEKCPPPTDEFMGKIESVLGDPVLLRLARLYRTPPDVLALVPESALRKYLGMPQDGGQEGRAGGMVLSAD